MGVFERGARWLEGEKDAAPADAPQILAGRVEEDVAVVLFVVEASDGSGPRALVNFYGREPGSAWVWEGQGGFPWSAGALRDDVEVVGRSETAGSEGTVSAVVGRARVDGPFAVPGAPEGVAAECDSGSDAFVAVWFEPAR